MLNSNIHILPLSGMTACYSAIGILSIVGYNHGTSQYQGPANSLQDFKPLLFVTGSVLSLLYSFYWRQGYVSFSEFFRIEKEANKKGEKAPTLFELKYGKVENEAIRCADRSAGNLLEQLIPFFLSMFAYATFVDVGGAAHIGWAWFAFRSYYPFGFKRFPGMFASTIPAYACVWYMMGSAVYAAATVE